MVNNVANRAKRHLILLNCCGTTTRGLIQSLAAPSKPTAVPYEELMKRVGTAHYNPRPLKIVSQFTFNEQPCESVATHEAGLYKIVQIL